MNTIQDTEAEQLHERPRHERVVDELINRTTVDPIGPAELRGS